MSEPNEAFRAEPPVRQRDLDLRPESALGERPPSEPTRDERTTCVLCHAGGFVTSFIVPLIIWSINKDKSRFVAEHAKEALNFQITLCIYWLVAFIIFPVLIVYEIVFIILAALAANRGEPYRIPLNIRFVK